LLGEVVRQLVDALQPEQIYVFGSRARGDSQVESDYDVMVIVRESDLPPHRRAQLAHHALQRIPAAADQTSPRDWQRRAAADLAGTAGCSRRGAGEPEGIPEQLSSVIQIVPGKHDSPPRTEPGTM
jgi:hypothetical protein